MNYFTKKATPTIMAMYKQILSNGLERTAVVGEITTKTPEAYNTILRRYKELGGVGFKAMEASCLIK